MRVSVLAAQISVRATIQDNLRRVAEIAAEARPGDLVVFPEGALSGYAPGAESLAKLNPLELRAAARRLQTLAAEHLVHIWAGTLNFEAGRWFNSALGFGPLAERYVYQKVNLTGRERGKITAGTGLPVYRLRVPGGTLVTAAQISQELRFPEQWGWLARLGAQVFIHLNHAEDPEQAWPVWRSHLVSRAAETQRYVVSVSGVGDPQSCVSLIAAPDGSILAEGQPGREELLRAELDLERVSNWTISQSRSDLLRTAPPEPFEPAGKTSPDDPG